MTMFDEFEIFRFGVDPINQGKIKVNEKENTQDLNSSTSSNEINGITPEHENPISESIPNTESEACVKSSNEVKSLINDLDNNQNDENKTLYEKNNNEASENESSVENDDEENDEEEIGEDSNPLGEGFSLFPEEDKNINNFNNKSKRGNSKSIPKKTIQKYTGSFTIKAFCEELGTIDINDLTETEAIEAAREKVISEFQGYEDLTKEDTTGKIKDDKKVIILDLSFKNRG